MQGIHDKSMFELLPIVESIYIILALVNVKMYVGVVFIIHHRLMNILMIRLSFLTPSEYYNITVLYIICNVRLCCVV